jgi:hypothetical protein
MGEKIVKRTNRAVRGRKKNESKGEDSMLTPQNPWPQYSSRLRRRTEAALEASELCKHNTVEDLRFFLLDGLNEMGGGR